MTISEENYEWKVRYEENLGIMVGAGTPTDRQRSIAKAHADEAIRKIREQNCAPTLDNGKLQ